MVRKSVNGRWCLDAEGVVICVCVLCAENWNAKCVTEFLSGLSNVRPGCGIVQLSSAAATLNWVMQYWVLPL